MVGSAFFPAASMLFFVVPFAGDDPVGATYATAVDGHLRGDDASTFQYGIGVAEDRAQPVGPVHPDPAGRAGPRFAGRILAGLVLMFLSLLPVVIIAAVATADRGHRRSGCCSARSARRSSARCRSPCMGLAIGYSLPSKAAIVVAQVIFFPLAFGGGLLSAPGDAPGFIETIAPYLPTRGAVELMWAGGRRLRDPTRWP